MTLRRAGLATALAVGTVGLPAACARQSAPPGGPPDQRPPVVIAVEPDTFAIVEPGPGKIRIRFDERISERPMSGTLDGAVHISPVTGNLRVSHERDGLDVTLAGGFKPGVVYRVTLDPVIRDMFGNALRVPFEWVFSTGGEFQPNAVGGLVWDRLTGEPVEDVDVLLRPVLGEEEADSAGLMQLAVSDTAGFIALRYLPAGAYEISAFQDRNRNGEPDPFEFQGVAPTLRIGATDTVFMSLAVMIPDTTAPQVVRVEASDSLTVVVTMDDPIDPEADLSQGVSGVTPEDGPPLAVARVLQEFEWPVFRDSLRAMQDSMRAAQAAAARDTALVEPAGAVVDTAAPPADTAALALEAARAALDSARAAAPSVGLPRRGQGTAGRGEREFLPDGSRVPNRTFHIRLREPLVPGVPYTVRIQGIPNLVGMVSEPEDIALTLPLAEAPAADTAGVVADTARVPPDTNRVILRRP